MQQGIYHVPVMLQEVIEGLKINPSGVYVDCTFGGGGHSKAILDKLNEEGKLIAFDQDEDAKRNLPIGQAGVPDERIIFVPQNFRHLQRFLRLHKINQVDGILADLGVSSYQFDSAERGFSTRFDAAMDMRMDKRQQQTAFDILKKYPEEKLHKIFEQYGEVTNAKTLARTIAEQRSKTSMQTIADFKNAVHSVVKGNPNKYFAQVFQALRIEVNDELGALKEMLQQSTDVLKEGGRIAIITFHSLEDRVVKNFYKGSEDERTDEIYGIKIEKPFNILTKKPIVPGEEEIKKNPRARSAKLRIAEKKKLKT
ncbi:MAG TPA: 16S rRNA (cytosine(1402)-N(4))-methyltransferase RsmH [Chitinophagaceae bacterium]|nr:16S rRNA (cytosine(1402)-N(4))-methyltransferase RsmH [Chitinophagaceae bacterium]